jgi:hypothetical protein
MYMLHELSMALHAASMVNGTNAVMSENTNATVAYHIDSAWAHYAGSNASALTEVLARRYRLDFATCDVLPMGILSAFKAAQASALTESFDKEKLASAINSIVPLVTAPLAQVCLRFAYTQNSRQSNGANSNLAQVVTHTHTLSLSL